MSTPYEQFLASKATAAPSYGHRIDPSEVHPFLHDFQRDIVTWAVEKGRAALWEDTGLGKTVQLLEWARLSGDTSLIVAPLAVCQQTARTEAPKVDLDVRYVRDQSQVTGPGIWITNYEMADRFDPRTFDAMVLDEASILKNEVGKTRTKLIKHFAPVPRRLDCTATPAPNDADELTSHAEFLGICSRTDMLATYFIHDQDGWRPKKHAVEPMYRFLASWATALRRPSDLGDYPDDGYILPGLRIIPELLPVKIEAEGQLFPTSIGGVGGRATVRRQTLDARCERVAELVAAEPREPWLIWCGLNDEADLLAKLVGGAVNVHGSMTPEEKAETLLGFASGDIQILVTKPKIASFGMNWQHAARMAFVGLSDSYEAYYQCIRRCYRYGQPRVVHAHIVLSELEAQIAQNVARKERDAAEVMNGMVRAMRRARAEELITV